jgi:hypothetical protein
MKFFLTVAILGLFAMPPADAQIRAKAKQRILEKQQKQADAVDRFLAMSPAERRQALAQLPPARQRQLLQRLKALELLSEDERNVLRGRQQAFTSLLPARRQAVRQELQNLRKMSRDDRRRRLASDDLKQNFSEEERQLLNDVAGDQPPQE